MEKVKQEGLAATAALETSLMNLANSRAADQSHAIESPSSHDSAS